MQRHHACWLLPAALALAATAATAQPGPVIPASITPAPIAPAPIAPAPITPADPLDATAQVPLLLHRSALASFRHLGASDPLPWREANDRVGRIGGWRAYAREANAPEAAASAPPAPKPAIDATAAPLPKPVPRAQHDGHAGHPPQGGQP